MSELGTMYTGCRERITELVRPLDAGAAARTAVPACPEWSVHDLLAHLVGSADDVLARRLDGSPGQAWTAAQVEARRNRPIGDLLAEWEVLGRSIQELIDATASRGPLDFGDSRLRAPRRVAPAVASDRGVTWCPRWLGPGRRVRVRGGAAVAADSLLPTLPADS
jgi:hypothetical protein